MKHMKVRCGIPWWAMTWLRFCQKKTWASLSSDQISQHEMVMSGHGGPSFDPLHVIGHHPRSLGRLFPMHVEDFCLAKCNAFGRLFADPAHKSRSGWHNSRERERIFNETFKFCVVHLRGTMCALKVITTRGLALEMANTSRGTKCKTNVVCNVGGLSLRPNNAIISLVHAIQRLGPGLR